MECVSLAKIVSLEGDKALVAVGGWQGLERSERFLWGKGPRLVVLIVGLLLELLIRLWLVGHKFAFGELILRTALALALASTVLGGRVSEK